MSVGGPQRQIGDHEPDEWTLAMQVELEQARMQLAQLARANSTLSGQNTDLGDRLLLAEAKVQDLHAVAIGAGRAVERLQAQLKALADVNGELAQRIVRLEAVVQAARQFDGALNEFDWPACTASVLADSYQPLHDALAALDDAR